ncbi:DUF5074 domain-containing protein [Chitinophaga sp. Mgbs1]|uniref:DUF5074 domain-containing protein n=1 Tax=Chitinophaga solisilvae TaxID=1233460 RepID=A0A433WJF8_9BACT|nr:DUF5074 domain-containing protein [Chitinophaga solisilvae]
MHRISHRFKHLFLLATAAVLTFTACSKKDNIAEIVVPQITAPGLNNGKDTIGVGDTRVIRPQLANVTNPTFLWLVNGEVAGTDSIYTFTPAKTGDYTISFKVSSGNSLNSFFYRIKVVGKYDNGFYLVNEGWFTHEPGSVSFYRNGADTIYKNVYDRENPGKTIGNSTDFGAIYNGKMYLVSKQGAFVVTDAYSMKETGRIDNLPADGRAFCGIDNNRGLISTADGIYPLNLQTLAIGTKIPGISGQVGTMLKAGNYIFAMSQDAGIVVLNASNYAIVKTLMKADVGLARTADGTIWAGIGKQLIAIDPLGLTTTTVAVPFDLYGAWGAWNATMITASTTENAVWIAKTNAWGAGGREIYKYLAGNPASLQTPFVTLPADRELYGAGFRYNPGNNTIIATSVEPGYGSHYSKNTMFIYNAFTGATVKAVPYEGYFFPAIPVFN